MNTGINAIRYLRTHAGLSVEELSEKTSVPTYDIVKLEANNLTVEISKATALAKYFGVSVGTILGQEESALIDSLDAHANRMELLDKRCDEQQARNRETAHRGEQWVYEQEQKALQGTKYEKAINPNYSQEAGSHFDLMSFDEDGKYKLIEVKTTAGSKDNCFFMSEKELLFAQDCAVVGRPYEIHRVHDVYNSRYTGREVITLNELFDDYNFTPTAYRVEKKQ